MSVQVPKSVKPFIGNDATVQATNMNKKYYVNVEQLAALIGVATPEHTEPLVELSRCQELFGDVNFDWPRFRMSVTLSL